MATNSTVKYTITLIEGELPEEYYPAGYFPRKANYFSIAKGMAQDAVARGAKLMRITGSDGCEYSCNNTIGPIDEIKANPVEPATHKKDKLK